MPTQTAALAAPTAPNLTGEAIQILSATFREMISLQSTAFHVVSVDKSGVGYRSALPFDNAVPSAEAGDIIVEVGHDMDLEALARSRTLSDLVCARIIGQVLYDREADASHHGDEGKLLFTTSAMLLLLSNRDDWRLAAGPNEWGHVYLYDGIIDHSFYKAFEEMDGRRTLQHVCDFETRMSPVMLALEAIVAECFEDNAQGWYPLPHLAPTIGHSVAELVSFGLERSGQAITPAPALAAIA